jgi:hypothetical protein
VSSSSVVAFPLYRRQKLVNGISSVLRAKQGDDATLFWRETAKHLLQQLLASGVQQQAAEQEVRQLLYAALRELEDDPARAGA